jgi:hypothetical protein
MAEEEMDEEEKVLAGHPDANMPALLTQDVPGGWSHGLADAATTPRDGQLDFCNPSSRSGYSSLISNVAIGGRAY